MGKENEKTKGILDSLKELFKKTPQAVIIVIIVAVALMLIFLGGGEKTESADLENRLEELCSSLAGVGDCRVMVTYRESEGRYGAEKSEVVESVTVVCRGADRAGVRSELVAMLSSLFGIGSNRIYIARMK